MKRWHAAVAVVAAFVVGTYVQARHMVDNVSVAEFQSVKLRREQAQRESQREQNNG